MPNNSYRTRFPGNPHLENKGGSSGPSSFLLLPQFRPWDLSWHVWVHFSRKIVDLCYKLSHKKNSDWESAQASRQMSNGCLSKETKERPPPYLSAEFSGKQPVSWARSKEGLWGSNTYESKRRRQHWVRKLSDRNTNLTKVSASPTEGPRAKIDH